MFSDAQMTALFREWMTEWLDEHRNSLSLVQKTLALDLATNIVVIKGSVSSNFAEVVTRLSLGSITEDPTDVVEFITQKTEESLKKIW